MEYLDHGKEYLYSKDGGHVKSCCTEKIILCPLQYGACLQYVHLIMKGHSGFVVLNGTQLKGIQLSSRRLLFFLFVQSSQRGSLWEISSVNMGLVSAFVRHS